MTETLNPEEIRQWLDDHEQTPPKNCVLCDEPVAKDTVIDHLVQKHEHWQVALLVALWWFLSDEEEQ